MWRIIRGLYLGDRLDAYDRAMLIESGVTHIVNCAVELPCWYRKDFKYLHLRLYDPDPSFSDQIERFVRFINRGRRTGAVLVHCVAGLSRSPSVILTYLCSRGRTLDEAIDILSRAVQERDEAVLPNSSFLEQIELYIEEEGFDST